MIQERKIIGSLNSGHSFFKVNEKIKIVTFLFCNFEMCSITKLNAEEIVFIGCHFTGGHITDVQAKNLTFIACSNFGEQIEVALSNFERVMFKSSNIELLLNLDDQVINSLHFSEENQQIMAELLEDEEDFPQEKIDFIVELLRETTDLSLFLFYGISIMLSEESIRLQFVDVFLEKLPTLPQQYQAWFKDFFEYLIEDKCPFTGYEDRIEAFMQSVK